MDRTRRILSAAALTLAAGCTSTTTDIPLTVPEAAVVSDEVGLTDVDTAMAFAVTDPFSDTFLFAASAATVSASFNPNVAAQQATAAAGNYFAPAGCFQASASGSTTLYVFNNCNGPLSVDNISGDLAATFSQGAAGVQVHLVSSNLTVGGVAHTIDSTGVIGSSNGQRTLSLSSTTTRVGTTRTSQSVFAWTKGTPCIGLNGTTTRGLNGITYTLTTNGFNRCSGQCPTSGTMTASGPDRTATLRFDGSTTPSATTNTGQNGFIQLACP